MLQGSFNGERLKEARLFNKKTITELSNHLKVSKQMISKYEKNRATPSEESIEILEKTLNYPREFFFGTDNFSFESNGTFFRSRYTSTQKEKIPTEYNKRYIAIIRDYLSEFLDFPELNWELSGKDMSIEEYSQFIRKNWGIGNTPIDNLSMLLEEKGFVVARYDNHNTKVDAFSGTVKVNSNEYYVMMLEGTNYSFYRQQFSLAHELGHWLLHEESKNPQDMESIDYRKMEDEANEFAASFLLPAQEFENSVGTNALNLEHYRYLKRIWNVSIAMMIMRAKSLNLISSKEYTNLQRQLNYRKWRKNEPLDSTKLISDPIALKQGVELLVENHIVYDIQNDIFRKYGILLSNSMIENLLNLEKDYLNVEYYSEPNIISLNTERRKRTV
ncbi:XRE family transcriptional regulator [Streptococcus mutans]|uniref:XRE family transcriptional regulator n=1 Tax=Streptococcus mutans TaxID=1309 RepID=UPI0002B5A789|nr:XRE family transcriptional regulator [Streptococcus mutans]EMB62834.1 transcriptional regulator [Streptococcus mutans 1SM1]